jgi:hypothetical protein
MENKERNGSFPNRNYTKKTKILPVYFAFWKKSSFSLVMINRACYFVIRQN